MSSYNDLVQDDRLESLERMNKRNAFYKCVCGLKCAHRVGVLRPPELPEDGHPRTRECKCGKTMVRVA